jgi:hypothetical protein
VLYYVAPVVRVNPDAVGTLVSAGALTLQTKLLRPDYDETVETLLAAAVGCQFEV